MYYYLLYHHYFKVKSTTNPLAIPTELGTAVMVAVHGGYDSSWWCSRGLLDVPLQSIPRKSANVKLDRSVEDVGTLSGGTLGEETVAALIVGLLGGGSSGVWMRLASTSWMASSSFGWHLASKTEGWRRVIEGVQSIFLRLQLRNLWCDWMG